MRIIIVVTRRENKQKQAQETERQHKVFSIVRNIIRSLNVCNHNEASWLFKWLMK